jgi:hypothetical protein
MPQNDEHKKWLDSPQFGYKAFKDWEHEQNQRAWNSSPTYTEGEGYKYNQGSKFNEGLLLKNRDSRFLPPQKPMAIPQRSQFHNPFSVISGILPSKSGGSNISLLPEQAQGIISAPQLVADALPIMEGDTDHTDHLGINTSAYGLVDDLAKNPSATKRNNKVAKKLFGKKIKDLTSEEKRSVAVQILDNLDAKLNDYKDLETGEYTYRHLDPQHKSLVLDAKWHTGSTYKNLMSDALNHQYNPDEANTAAMTRESRRKAGGKNKKGLDNRVARLFDSVGMPVDYNSIPLSDMGPQIPPQHIGGATSNVNMQPSFQQAQEQMATPDHKMTMSISPPAQIPFSAPPNPYGNAGGGYADADMQRMVALSQQLQKPRGIMT